MASSSSLLMKEVYRVANQVKQRSITNAYKVEIHAGGKLVNPVKLTTITVIRDYRAEFASVLLVDAVFNEPDINNIIYPNRNNLLVTLYKTPLQSSTSGPNDLGESQAQTFQAVLADSAESRLNVGGKDRLATNVGDQDLLKSITFQLVDQAVEQIRMISTGGNFKVTTGADVLKTLLMAMTADLKIDNRVSVAGVDFIPADVVDKRMNVLIPHGTRLVDLGNYIQDKCGGIYTKEIGSFYQDNHWYIFPLYDVNRFETAKRRLDILLIPTQLLPEAELSYLDDGTTVTVISTNGVSQVDPSYTEQLNQGNGVRYTKAADVMNGFAETSNNRTILKGSRTNNEFIVKPSETGFNNIQNFGSRITDNHAKVLSRMAPRLGQYMTVSWRNSDPTLVIPGMPVRIFYDTNDEVKSYMGTVLVAQHDTAMHGEGINGQSYYTNTHLGIFISDPVQKVI